MHRFLHGHEQDHIKRFKSCFSGFPEGTLEKTERPDFVIRGQERNVGVELTRLFHDDTDGRAPCQAIEVERERVVSRAEELHRQRGLPPAWIWVTFRKRKQIGDIEAVAQRMVGHVEKHMPPFKETQIVDWTVERSLLHAPYRSIEIMRIFHAEGDPFWAVFASGAIPDLRIPQLQRAIDSHNSKLHAYRMNRPECSAFWLVVVAHGYRPSSWFHTSEAIKGHTFTSSFDRVFFLNYQEKQVVEMTCAA